MIESYSDLYKVIGETVVILALLLLIFRKHILSIFDPLFYYIVTQAFSIELAFLTIQTTSYLVNFLLCQSCFAVGFLLMAGRGLRAREIKFDQILKPDAESITVIKIFSALTFVVIFFSNLYLISQKGVALFAEDPSAAKGENFSEGGGFGIIRRMNWGVLYITSLLLLYLYLYKKQSIYLILCLVLIILVSLTGSKGALVYFITLIPLLAQFKDLRLSATFGRIYRARFVVLGLSVLLALFILSSGGGDAAIALGTRLLFFGDAMLYYYDKLSVKHFSHLNFIDFIKEDFNSLAGFFRLAPYKRPIGFDMVEYQVGFNYDSVFGPNLPYYVKGYIYFQAYGAIIYSLIVGLIVGYVRKWFYKLFEKKRSIGLILLIIHLNLVIVSYPQDSNFFIASSLDTLILSLPFYLIVWLLFKKSNFQHLFVLNQE